MTRIKTFLVVVLILSGAAALTYVLMWSVQFQRHIIPVEEREAESYIQRTAHRKRVKALRDHFHNIVEDPPSEVEASSVCFLCHTTLPHHKHKKIRALLNMHTFFLACETCHGKNETGEKVEYAWLDPEGADISKGHYGTRYHPLSGSLLRVNLQSRITPVIRRDGQKRFLIQRSDTPMAKDYLRMKDSLTEQEKDFAKKNFHKGINPVGSKCKECHTRDGKLDLKALGFSAQRRTDLENLSISGMLTRYETFYLPALFE